MRLLASIVLLSVVLVASLPAMAGPPTVELEIRGHLFYPSILRIPAHTKVRLVVINRDPTAEEFESYELNREKIIPGGATSVIFIGPLPPGEYFFLASFPQNRPGQGGCRVRAPCC